MAQRDVSSFKTTKNARYSDNSSGEVSAEDSRDMFEDVADSFHNKTDFPMEASAYTATITPVTGIDSVDAQKLWYTRMGNVVNVWGTVSVDTNVTSNIEFRVSLPIAKDISNANEIAGSCANFQFISVGGVIVGNTAEDEARVLATGTNTVDTYTIQFSYML